MLTELKNSLSVKSSTTSHESAPIKSATTICTRSNPLASSLFLRTFKLYRKIFITGMLVHRHILITDQSKLGFLVPLGQI